jgi:hypothetical protein
MHGTAEAPTMKTTVKVASKKKQLRRVTIEPAGNGYTVSSDHHGDYMEPGPPAKPKVFEKAHGHEMLKHVARKLGIKAKISEPSESESAAEDAGESGEE